MSSLKQSSVSRNSCIWNLNVISLLVWQSLWCRWKCHRLRFSKEIVCNLFVCSVFYFVSMLYSCCLLQHHWNMHASHDIHFWQSTHSGVKKKYTVFHMHFCLLYQGKLNLFSVPANLFYYYRVSSMVMISIQLHIYPPSYSLVLTSGQTTCQKRDGASSIIRKEKVDKTLCCLHVSLFAAAQQLTRCWFYYVFRLQSPLSRFSHTLCDSKSRWATDCSSETFLAHCHHHRHSTKPTASLSTALRSLL
jgi:hypothetical protein